VSQELSDVPILVIGAGPAGLAAAIELVRRGCAVRIIEKRNQREPHFKALSINTRTLELLEPSGVTERLLASGLKVPAVRYHNSSTELFRIDYTELAHRYNFMLALPQTEIESILETRLTELGVVVERGTNLVRLVQEGSMVTALAEAGGTEHSIAARYVIAADGARSTVRQLCEIDFPGSTMPSEWSLADVRMESPWPVESANIVLHERGMLFSLRIRDDLFRLGSSRPDVLTQLPIGVRVHETLWQTRFRVEHRQTRTYQAGRVYLVGDAAHVHAPMGARGMNMSIEDAVLLVDMMLSDTLHRYSSARLRAGAAALRMIKAQTWLVANSGSVSRYLTSRVIPVALRVPSVRRYLVRRMLGLGYA
jgi:2-polyprenyl-6-methoxyphenol hydroxylase-like FAD-dependent oxidoreductase